MKELGYRYCCSRSWRRVIHCTTWWQCIQLIRRRISTILLKDEISESCGSVCPTKIENPIYTDKVAAEVRL